MGATVSPVASQALLDAQVGVLGSMLIDPATVGTVMARTSARDFRAPQYRLVYEAIRSLFNRGAPVDAIAVNAELGGQSSQLLIQLMELTPTAVNCDEYIALLKQCAALDELRTIGEGMMGAQDLDAARTLMERAGAVLSAREELRVVSLRQGLRDFTDRQSQELAPSYLRWEFGLGDYLFVERGDFVVVGARPSVGKTAFALQEAFHQAERRRVGFFSLETGDRKLIDRLVANRAGVDMGRIKRHQLTTADCEATAELAHSFEARTLDLIPASSMTVSDIRAVALSRRYEVIYLDYLQLVAPAAGSQRLSSFDRVSQISKDLHALSQGTGITVVALSQLSRDKAQTGGKAQPPQLSDLRESGQIEQDADVVLFLSLEDADRPQGRRLLRIAKNKDGLAGGKALLEFDGGSQRFSRSAAIYTPPKPRKQAQTSIFDSVPEDGTEPF